MKKNLSLTRAAAAAVVCAAAAMLLSACSDKDTNLRVYDKPEVSDAEFIAHHLDTTILYSDRIFAVDGLLVNVNSQNRSGLMELFTLPDLKYAGTTGLMGRGPEEFDFVNTNGMSSGYGGIAVTEYDSYAVLDFSNEQEVQMHKKLKTKIPAANTAVNSLAVLSEDAAVIYMGNEDYTEFFMHNRTDGSLQPISKYPRELIDNQDATSIQCGSIFLNEMLVSESNRRFAAMYSQLPMLRIFDFDGSLLCTSLLSNYGEQKINIENGGVKSSLSYQYYLSAAANDRYICGLYIGMSGPMLRELNIADFRPEIHVWNWNGEPVAAFKTDRFVQHIALSDDNTLYAFSPMDEKCIYSFKIE